MWFFGKIATKGVYYLFLNIELECAMVIHWIISIFASKNAINFEKMLEMLKKAKNNQIFSAINNIDMNEWDLKWGYQWKSASL